MWQKLTLAFLVLLFCVNDLFAQARPVLLELFTSQGCRSCPAGEKVIRQLNERDDFFALSFHVDYWDKMGWQDPFAQGAFSQRQVHYMEKFENSSLYTPQVVVDGQSETTASWGWRVKMLASSARNNQVNVPIFYSQKNGREYVQMPAFDMGGVANIWYVSYRPEAVTSVTKGENQGRVLHSVNIVRSKEQLKVWDGQKELSLTLPLRPEGLEAAVVIQKKGMGPVVGLFYTEQK